MTRELGGYCGRCERFYSNLQLPTKSDMKEQGIEIREESWVGEFEVVCECLDNPISEDMRYRREK